MKKAKVQDVSTVKHVDQLHKISEKVVSEEQKYVRVGEDEEENKVEDPKEKSESQKMMKMESLLLELSIEEGPQRTSEEEMEWSEGKEEEDSSEMEEIYQAQGESLKRAPKLGIAKGTKIVKRTKKGSPKKQSLVQKRAK